MVMGRRVVLCHYNSMVPTFRAGWTLSVFEVLRRGGKRRVFTLIKFFAFLMHSLFSTPEMATRPLQRRSLGTSGKRLAHRSAEGTRWAARVL